jgi:vacuolar-type H+-ATPase subunit C/Vma6
LNYVVLRTHARIADLLTQEQMQTLADARDVADFLSKLEDTPYGGVTLDDESRPTTRCASRW